MKKIQRIIRNTFLVFKTFQERKTFKILQNWFKKKTDHDINKIIIDKEEKLIYIWNPSLSGKYKGRKRL